MSTDPQPSAAAPIGAAVTPAQARRISILLTAVVATGALSIDMFLPSLPAMAQDLNASAAAAQLTVTAFLASLAVAQLVLGPVSDKVGRRPVLLGGMALYTVAGWVCWAAPNMATLVVARCFQAFGAGAGTVLGRAIVRDLYPPQRAARVLAYIGTAHALTPILAPTVGGWMHAAFGWHSVFLVMGGCGILFSAAVYRLVPESLVHQDPLALNPTRLLSNIRVLFTDPVYLSYVAVLTLTFAGQFAFIAGSAYVLITVVQVSPQVYGLCFGAVAVGLMTGSFLSGRLTRRMAINTIILAGTGVCAVMGSVLAGLSLAGLFLTGTGAVWAIVGPMYGYAVGVGLVFPTASAGAVGPYPRMAGLASALLGFLMLTFCASYGTAVGALFDGTSRPMTVAIGLAGVSALACFVLLNRSWRRGGGEAATS